MRAVFFYAAEQKKSDFIATVHLIIYSMHRKQDLLSVSIPPKAEAHIPNSQPAFANAPFARVNAQKNFLKRAFASAKGAKKTGETPFYGEKLIALHSEKSVKNIR